jgi:cytochrome c oxidase subunit 2
MNPVTGVDIAFWYILGLSIIVLIGITVLMIVFSIKYRRSKNPIPADIRDNWMLETVWTVIPAILFLSMFVVGWTSYLGLRAIPEDGVVINVYAQQYAWIFVYENDKETEDELYVPVNKPIKLVLISEDVNHSFALPSYRIKVDAVPGMETYAWFLPDEEGEYDILCTEYCGVDHSAMVAKLYVVSEEEYNKWLEE